jgi:hypothetical protein
MFQGRGGSGRNYFRKQYTNRRESNIEQQEVEEQELKQKPRLTTTTQARLKATTKLIRQNLKANHHIELLSKAIEEKNPPRGLTPRINPRLPNPTTTWFIQWEEQQYQAGLNNTQMLVNYWTGRKKELAADLTTTTKLLEKDLDPEQKEEVQRILGEVERNVTMDLKRKGNRRRPDTTENTEPQPGGSGFQPMETSTTTEDSTVQASKKHKTDRTGGLPM